MRPVEVKEQNKYDYDALRYRQYQAEIRYNEWMARLSIAGTVALFAFAGLMITDIVARIVEVFAK